MARLLLLLTLILMTGAARPADAADVDMQLVLAIDVSSSVSWDEYNLQMQGFASAFRDEQVIEAIAAGPIGQISVTVTHWAGLDEQQVMLGWRVISGPEEARAFADSLDNVPRAFPYGGTAISDALDHAHSLFAKDSNFSQHRVIDVSGDGKSSIGASPEAARDRVVGDGIIINGLPILDGRSDLEIYYRQHVIGGPGAFTELARGYDDFARAITSKLVREIRGTWQGV
ncbi:MAG: hypothetical protein COB93_09665 [Sneathiella sp.]|nr:MAG: hypothetical protein COB93_09665 [Sneathiella sp.]